MPGDRIAIPPFFFTHTMNVEQVSADFVHQDDPNSKITLVDNRKKDPPEDKDPVGIGNRHSSVLLQARIPGNALPGVYRCQSIYAHTVGGQTLKFDDPYNEVDYVFAVLNEPDTPPQFGVR